MTTIPELHTVETGPMTDETAPASAEERQEGARRVAEAIGGLLASRELPDIVEWDIRTSYTEWPHAQAQISVVGGDTEARRRIAQMLWCLDAAQITETRSHADTYTVLEATGTYRDVPIRAWTHVDHTVTEAQS